MLKLSLLWMSKCYANGHGRDFRCAPIGEDNGGEFDRAVSGYASSGEDLDAQSVCPRDL